jgi:hypothetical protein
MIVAYNGHLLAFDNVSSVSPWLADALCRVVSGGSFAIRQLFTDQDEILFQDARPILLNGIETVIHRADLADCEALGTRQLPRLSDSLERLTPFSAKSQNGTDGFDGCDGRGAGAVALDSKSVSIHRDS